DPAARVVALVDPRAEALKAELPSELAEAKAYQTAEAMLDAGGLDGVMIGTRCSLHAPYAAQVLARDLPLFLEKPGAISHEQTALLRKALAATRSQVVVSFPLRVSALCELARQIVDSGGIGTVEHVQAVNNVPAYAAGYYHGWMRDEDQTGGLWLQKATHDFDYPNYLVGPPPPQGFAHEAERGLPAGKPARLRCPELRPQ